MRFLMILLFSCAIGHVNAKDAPLFNEKHICMITFSSGFIWDDDKWQFFNQDLRKNGSFFYLLRVDKDEFKKQSVSSTPTSCDLESTAPSPMISGCYLLTTDDLDGINALTWAHFEAQQCTRFPDGKTFCKNFAMRDNGEFIRTPGLSMSFIGKTERKWPLITEIGSCKRIS